MENVHQFVLLVGYPPEPDDFSNVFKMYLFNVNNLSTNLKIKILGLNYDNAKSVTNIAVCKVSLMKKTLRKELKHFMANSVFWT